MSEGESIDFGNTAEDVPSSDLRIITVKRFRALEAALRERGFGPEIDHAQHRTAPADARTFALEVAYVITNSGMRASVAGPIYAACEAALDRGVSATTVFGHAGKAAAIDAVWRDRERLFIEFGNTADVVAFCERLPFIGPITKFHLAKNLGGNFVKPDVHLTRLAAAEGTSTWELCHRLAVATGFCEAAVDTVLWRACAEGLIDSRRLAEA